MMRSWNENIFRVTVPLCGEFTSHGYFPAQRPVTRRFDIFSDLGPNKRLSKQSGGCWFEKSLRPLWRHSNVSFQWVSHHTPCVASSVSASHYTSRNIDSGNDFGMKHVYTQKQTQTRRNIRTHSHERPHIYSGIYRFFVFSVLVIDEYNVYLLFLEFHITTPVTDVPVWYDACYTLTPIIWWSFIDKVISKWYHTNSMQLCNIYMNKWTATRKIIEAHYSWLPNTCFVYLKYTYKKLTI